MFPIMGHVQLLDWSCSPIFMSLGLLGTYTIATLMMGLKITCGQTFVGQLQTKSLLPEGKFPLLVNSIGRFLVSHTCLFHQIPQPSSLHVLTK